MTTQQQHWTHWLGRLKPGARVRQNARRVPDFADYGTAFGLDLSLSASAAASALARGAAASTAEGPGTDAHRGEPADAAKLPR
ncbi:hypothetical protein [Sphaerotilus microaerophilus]|uniref:Uncharacterized protein n=1 Tax=Sphaerotilus microaerophilus TaxID=2914710 RepID=A0ABM7YRF6_9BURK|nr:hypothetical protein [Sphaerotilus sp. FB-5]BDI07152.1 hypothetical protein CATMQ487_41220 [Sphaerotilus sp. FB-5]